MNKPKLFLIDAYALIFRGYYAFIKNPRINSKGFDTSAIMGFLNSIFDLDAQIVSLAFFAESTGSTNFSKYRS